MLKLFDGYVHGMLNRREFLNRAAKFTIGGFTAAAMLERLTPNYARAQQVAKDDGRIKTEYLTYPSPQGSGAVCQTRSQKTRRRPRGRCRLSQVAPRVHRKNRRGGLLLRRRHRQPPGGAAPGSRAAVPFYGSQPAAADVAKIKAPLLIHYAALDERINAGWPAYEAALKANGVRYDMHMYPNTNHGFHNDTTPRYDEAAAKLAWQRTVDFFNKHVRGS